MRFGRFLKKKTKTSAARRLKTKRKRKRRKSRKHAQQYTSTKSSALPPKALKKRMFSATVRKNPGAALQATTDANAFLHTLQKKSKFERKFRPEFFVDCWYLVFKLNMSLHCKGLRSSQHRWLERAGRAQLAAKLAAQQAWLAAGARRRNLSRQGWS